MNFIPNTPERFGAFEIDLEFANGETIPNVDIDFTIVDNNGGKVQWLKKQLSN